MHLQNDDIDIVFSGNNNCAVSRFDRNSSVGLRRTKQTVFGKVVGQEGFDTRLILLDSVFAHLGLMTKRSR